MPTPPPSITPAPQPPPQRGDRATFSDRVDRWVTWMSEVPADFQAVANNVYANALEASAAITAIPPIAGNATKSLRVNAAGTAMEWVQDGAALGFTPVQQGGGVGQDSVKVNIGRGTGTAALKATIGSTDLGYLATSSTDPTVAITAPAFVGNGAGLTGFTPTQINTALGFAASALPAAGGVDFVGVRAGQTLGDIYDVVYIATAYNDIENILDATTGPVAIRIPVGVFAAPPESKWRDDVALLGDKLPRVSGDRSRLISGSVIQGTTKFILKQRCLAVNVGFDRGQHVCDTKFGGAYGDALVVTSWNGDVGSPNVALDGWYIDNVIALIPDSNGGTPASVPFHGALLEGFSASCYIGTVDGHGGIASTVLKGSAVEPKMLKGTGGNPYTVALKSNTYARFSDVTIGQLVSVGGGGPAIIADDNTVGAPLDRLTIGQYTQRGGKFGLRTDSADAGRTISNVSIGQARCFGVEGSGMSIKGPNTSNVTILNHDFEGCGNSLYVGDGAAHVDIGTGTSRASLGHGYMIQADGVSAGDLRATDSVGAGFFTTTNDFTARKVSGAGNAGGLYGGTARPLTIESSDPFDVTLSEGIQVDGTATPKMAVSSKLRINGRSGAVSATSGTIDAGRAMAVLPEQLRPLTDKLCSIVAFVSGNFSSQTVSIDAATGTITYRGLPATIVYFSELSFDRP